MISLHTSPLATPGVGDAGGLNVYVAELARRLGERGLKVDVFTRAEDDTPDVVEINEHTRVINLEVGPREQVAKENLPRLVGEFAARLDPFIERYDLVHTHYWLSGVAGIELKHRHGVPLVHTMHTMARVKNAALRAAQQAEPDIRDRGEAEVVAKADGLTAN